MKIEIVFIKKVVIMWIVWAILCLSIYLVDTRVIPIDLYLGLVAGWLTGLSVGLFVFNGDK